jgi:peptide/nickel transport system permease protein
MRALRRSPIKSDPVAARRRRTPVVSFIILGVLLLCAVAAPLLAPHNPTDIDIRFARLAPGENWSYPLGTDLLGRDVLSRLIFGARTSVVVAFLGLAGSAVVGTVVGTVAGYFGGAVDTVLMRIVDIGLSFPTILAALLIAVFMGIGMPTLIVAVTVTMWAKFARMIRGDVLAVRRADFVLLAQIGGVRAPRIMVRHILPNVVGTFTVVSSVLLGQVILLEASLSFLGLGLPPGAAAWGVMVAEGQAYLTEVWWLSFFPGCAITGVVLATNLVGDWLRESLDPEVQVL